MTDTVTLEPCPFCGKEGWLFKHSSAYTDEYSVRCENGCCEVGDEYEADAVALWNTRPLAMRSASPVDTGDAIETLSRENRELREALETIHDTFQRDLDQGYKTADKIFAVDISRTTLGKESAAQPHPGKER